MKIGLLFPQGGLRQPVTSGVFETLIGIGFKPHLPIIYRGTITPFITIVGGAHLETTSIFNDCSARSRIDIMTIKTQMLSLTACCGSVQTGLPASITRAATNGSLKSSAAKCPTMHISGGPHLDVVHSVSLHVL